MAFLAGFLTGVLATLGLGVGYTLYLMKRPPALGGHEKQKVRETASAVLNAEDPARRHTIHARP